MTNIVDEFEDFESPLENPEALAAAAATLAEETKPPTLPNPLDGPVTLPGGLLRTVPGKAPEVITKAWVRELNGEDEERIAKTRLREDYQAFIDTLLECGVERLGNEAPTTDDLRSLLIGDRDFLLLQISRATYGNDLEYVDLPCTFCNEPMTFTVHKDEDIPVVHLDKVEHESFEVRLRNEQIAKVHLPTGEIQVAIREADTEAEANTVLLANCVEEIRGPKGSFAVAGDQDMVRKLGIKDRQTLLDEMSKRMPGPQYTGVTFTHPSCGREVRLAVQMADLFQGL